MKRYSIVIEPAGTGVSAYSPDAPQCVATGRTADEVRELFRAALEFHFEGLREEGLPLPTASTVVDYVDVAA